MFILGIIIGSFLGIILMALCASNRIGDLQRESYNAEERALTHFERADKLEKLNKKYQEEHEILLNNSAELRAKIVDLENNVEFLYNNLTPAKKKLARPDNQN